MKRPRRGQPDPFAQPKPKRSHHAPPAAAARATRYGLSARDRQRLVYALSALGDCRAAVLRAMGHSADPERGDLVDPMGCRLAYELILDGLRQIAGDE